MAREGLVQQFLVKVDRLNEGLEAEAEAVAEFGQELVRGAIETRGTGRVWKRTYHKNGVSRRASIPGRVWTGKMRDSVKNRVRASGTEVVASYGWIDHYEDYFGQQEAGFTHETGVKVPGMFAMADSVEPVRKRVIEGLRRIARGF